LLSIEYEEPVRLLGCLNARIKAHLYFGHATQDRTMPQVAIEKLNAALAQWGGKYESEITKVPFAAGRAGYHAYNQTQADRAFTKLLQLFTNNLQHRTNAQFPTDSEICHDVKL
jgi:dienelactone hydrolase